MKKLRFWMQYYGAAPRHSRLAYRSRKSLALGAILDAHRIHRYGWEGDRFVVHLI